LLIKIISIGSPPSSSVNALIDEYTSRITNFTKIEWVNHQIKSKEKNILLKKELEAKKILSSITKNSFVIALDENGQPCNSNTFSTFIQQTMMHHSEMIFLIGGADGLSKGILEKCNKVLSLSNLTFPHQLVKVLIIEQIYRGFSIINNLPYHRE
jgi:23S rRNA (pseudouridine1915-N3)-methyltransferase